MDNGEWTMDNGQWTMDNGQWTMDNFRASIYGYSRIIISRINPTADSRLPTADSTLRLQIWPDFGVYRHHNLSLRRYSTPEVASEWCLRQAQQFHQLPAP